MAVLRFISNQVVVAMALALVGSLAFLGGAISANPASAVHSGGWVYLHPSAAVDNPQSPDYFKSYLRCTWHNGACPNGSNAVYKYALDWADTQSSPPGDVMNVYFHYIGWHYDRSIWAHELGYGWVFTEPYSDTCDVLFIDVYNHLNQWVGRLRYLHVSGPVNYSFWYYGLPDNTGGYHGSLWIANTVTESPPCSWQAAHVHEDQHTSSSIFRYPGNVGSGWHTDPTDERGFAP